MSCESLGVRGNNANGNRIEDTHFAISDTRVGDAIWQRNLTLLLYLAIAVWLIAWFSFGYGYWEDDAFIHLEFA
jgi:hypothetical protein